MNFFGFWQFQAPAPNELFHANYRIHAMPSYSDLEEGDKILLPPQVLEAIARTNTTYPLIFSLSYKEYTTYCGVSEFTAPIGQCIVPKWIMKKITSPENAVVKVSNICIEKAQYIKFRFNDPSFGQLSNPKSILENKLKSFSVCAANDRLEISHLGKKYQINVAEVKPGKVVCIIEADVQVDFDFGDLPNKNKLSAGTGNGPTSPMSPTNTQTSSPQTPKSDVLPNGKEPASTSSIQYSGSNTSVPTDNSRGSEDRIVWKGQPRFIDGKKDGPTATNQNTSPHFSPVTTNTRKIESKFTQADNQTKWSGKERKLQ